jgi:PAS domain S-box-containing protein
MTEHKQHDDTGKSGGGMVPPGIPEGVMRMFIESASIPLVAFDLDGRVVFCTRHATEILQLRAGELDSYDALATMRVRDRSILRSHLDTVISGQQSARCECEMTFPGHNRQWVRLVSYPGGGVQGQTLCWSSVENLTQIKRLEKTEALFQRAASIQGTTGSLKEFSAQIFDLLRILFGVENGYVALLNPSSGMIEFPFYVDQKDPPPVPRKPDTGITDYVITMGRLVWLFDARSGRRTNELGFQITGTQPSDWIGVPLVNSGRVSGMVAIQTYEENSVFSAKDIGLMLGVGHLFEVFLDRVKMQEHQSRLTAAIEQVAETVLITDIHGVIVYVNPAFEKVTGYTCEEAIGKTPAFIQSGKHEKSYYRDMWNTLLAGQTWRGRFTNKRKDGALYEEEAVISPVLNREGQTVHYVAVKRDITKESSLEKRYLYAQKMQAASKLVEGISHDFRNLLMVIRQNAELLQQHAGTPNSNSDELLQVLKATDQSESLIRQLAVFSNKSDIDQEKSDPNAFIQQFEGIAKSLIGELYILRLDLSPRVSEITINRGQVEQALANLIINAADAMPSGGEIEIRTYTDTIRQPDVEMFAESPPIDDQVYVIFDVIDHGTGIQTARPVDLFAHGYTTKKSSGEKGLGLPVCLEIMHKHRGYIAVRKNLPEGMVFSLYFPVAPATSPEPVVLKLPDVELAHGSETILLAEDEEGARRVISRMLQDHGYKVIEAENGSMAIRSLLYNQGAIHMLLTDIMMPDFDGRALAEQIRGLQPAIKVVYVSGYDESHLEETGVIAPGEHINLVKKPFRREDLIPLVRKVLDEPVA